MGRVTRRDPDPPPSSGDLVKIGEFARRAGTNLRTLRYYEEIGLLVPAHRSSGGFRYYRPTDVHRLRMVQTLQELGLPLERIRDLLATRTAQANPASDLVQVRDALLEQDRLLAERLESIADQRERIRQALHKLGECHGCTRHPSLENNFCEPCEVDGHPLPDDLSALF
jgi:DNA-binding transcriptional MerR regulator